MERAIRKLAQLGDPDLFEQVSIGVEHVLENVNELQAATRHLLQVFRAENPDRPSLLGTHPAKVLQILATEEAAKVLILLDAVRCPTPETRSRVLGYFYQHLAKGIYAEICGLHFTDFSDLTRLVENERAAYYLDGPNDVDWILPNLITQRRESALYVDFVCEDDQDECYWTFPDKEPPVPHFTPPIIQVAEGLHRAGATSPAGLEVIGRLWRPVKIGPEMPWDELARMNLCTLKMLQEHGLLLGEPDVHRVIVRQWPFPLWPLDLGTSPRDPKERKAEKERLRRAREAWDPGGWRPEW